MEAEVFEKDEDHVDRLLSRIKELMSQEGGLTETEIKELKEIIEYKEEIVQEYKYKRAKALILKEYRALIIAIAAGLALLVAFAKNLKEFLSWF